MSEGFDPDALRTGGALDVLSELAKQADSHMVGREFGGYRITGLIAEGGMGRVYRAERVDGSFEREVAIKISTINTLDKAALGRFKREQTVLAGFNHPNISHLYDVRVTPEGWPYIVMEHVDGVSISEHCQQISHEARIRLLVDVVDAVAYAHARLVVHRDIKPANVLVNQEGHPKLLDFGIAKLLEGGSQEITAARPMTPRYASPEQLLEEPITVASDIYQLGLLLYEVTVGAPLSQTDDLTSAIRRAAARESVSLPLESRRILAKDLVLIIEKCLRAEPEERYRDANSLKRDLEAMLDGFPVQAAGPGTFSRVRKFIRRNLAACVTTSAAVVALAASTSWYVVEVAKERDEARQQTALANESLEFLASFFTGADPRIAQGEELTARELLESGAARIESELSDQPAIQSRLYRRIAETYRVLGDLDKAERYAMKSLVLVEELYGEHSTENLGSLMILGHVAAQSGDFETAADHYQTIIETATPGSGDHDEHVAEARHNLASIYWNTGRIPEAIATMEAVVAQKAILFGRAHQSTIGSAAALADFYKDAGRLDEAIDLSTVNLEIANESLGPNHQATLIQMATLGYALYHRDGVDAALPLLEEQLERVRIVFGEDSFDFLRKKVLVAGLRAEAGDTSGGIAAFVDAMEKMSALRGADHPVVLLARINHASLLVDAGRIGRAKSALEDLIPVHDEVRGEDHPNSVYARILYARILYAEGDVDAHSRATELLEHVRRSQGPDHYWVQELETLIADNRSATDPPE